MDLLRVIILATASLATLAPGAAHRAAAEPSTTEPAAGRLLVANRDLRSPMFGRSVVLLLRSDATGAIGLILNRQSEVALSELLPQLSDRPGSATTLRVGGPVARRSIHLLIRADEPPRGARRILDSVYYSREWELLRELVNDAEAGSSYRVYVGYSGWAPGQLEAEIARGDWLVMDAAADDVFLDGSRRHWNRLLPQSPRNWTRARPSCLDCG